MSKSAQKMIFGNIYTGDENDSFVSALGISEGKIVFAGSEADAAAYINEETEITRLPEGQLVTPGIMDGHSHVTNILAAKAVMCVISEDAVSTSAQAVADEMAAFVAAHPEFPYYIGHNWVDSLFPGNKPTAELLDAIPTDKPIYLLDNGGHSYWTNTAMVKLAGITADTPDPEGGKIERYEDGTPCGCFRDTALFIVKKALPLPTPESKIAGIQAAQEMYEQYGYTAYFEALTNDQATPSCYPVIQGFEKEKANGRLDVYTMGSFVINNTPDAMDMVKLAIKLRDETKGGMFELGSVKLFMDGVVEGGTAYLSKPYANKPEYYGASRWADNASLKRLSDIIAMANEADMPCHIHTIGDQAIKDALTAIERAQKKTGKKGVRNVLTHLQVVDPADYQRFVDLGVVANINPWANKGVGFYNETEVMYLGEERASQEYPYKSFLDAGVHVGFGTDYGCSFVADPIECFHVLTTRTDKTDNPETTLKPSESLSRVQAIRAMTIGTAYQMNVEDRMGSLEVGKDANLIVISKDILTIPDSELMSAKVLATMCIGKWVYKA